MTDTRIATAVVPESHRDLLEQPLIAHLATVRPDGIPQSNPVWFDWDGEHLKISQTKARQKMHNIDNDPHVALSVTDPENPYRYLEVRGEVGSKTTPAARSSTIFRSATWASGRIRTTSLVTNGSSFTSDRSIRHRRRPDDGLTQRASSTSCTDV